MKFPLAIASQDKNKGLEIWNNQFISTGRHIHEGIWRRTQAKENKAQSKWKSEKDRRWRVVHFIDNYDIDCKGKQSEEGNLFKNKSFLTKAGSRKSD